jgi:hypothetical protein
VQNTVLAVTLLTLLLLKLLMMLASIIALLTETSHSCRNTVLAVMKPTSCSSPYGPTAANAAHDQILQARTQQAPRGSSNSSSSRCLDVLATNTVQYAVEGTVQC